MVKFIKLSDSDTQSKGEKQLRVTPFRSETVQQLALYKGERVGYSFIGTRESQAGAAFLLNRIQITDGLKTTTSAGRTVTLNYSPSLRIR